MNTEKCIANTCRDAQMLYEDSYSSETYEYEKTLEACLIEAGKKHELSENMWALLALACHWMNKDVQLWAGNIIAGRNITAEPIGEKGDAKDEIT